MAPDVSRVLHRSFALALLALVLSAGLGIALHTASAASAPRPAACATRPPIELPVNAWAPARNQLAPPGAVAIRLCRYKVLPPKRGLAASTLITGAATVAELVTELDALRSPPTGAVYCPDDSGAEIDMLLAYSDGHGVFIEVALTGCTIVSNGTLVRTAAGAGAGHALLEQIERLTDYRGPTF